GPWREQARRRVGAVVGGGVGGKSVKFHGTWSHFMRLCCLGPVIKKEMVMWTRRDWALLGTAAFATFGVTVATFLPRVATADDEKKVTTTVPVPTLHLANVDVVGQVAASEQVTASNPGAIQVKPGSQPKLQFVVQNNTKEE